MAAKNKKTDDDPCLTHTEHELDEYELDDNMDQDECILLTLQAMAELMEAVLQSSEEVEEYVRNSKNVRVAVKDLCSQNTEALANISKLINRAKRMFKFRKAGNPEALKIGRQTRQATSQITPDRIDRMAKQAEESDGPAYEDSTAYNRKKNKSEEARIVGKRKEISPLDKEVAKRPRATPRQELGSNPESPRRRTYADAIRNPMQNRDNGMSDEDSEWLEPRRRRKARKEDSMPDRTRKIPGRDSKKKMPPRRQPPPRSDAILVKSSEKDDFLTIYKDIVNRAKAKINNVKRVRKTRAGDLLIELEGQTPAEEMREIVAEAAGEGRIVRTLQKKALIEIRDIDPLVQKEEVAAEVLRILDTNSPDILVRSLRTAFAGMQRAIIEIPQKLSQKIRDNPRLRLGLTVARLRVMEDLTRCYRCLGFGHLSTGCKGIPVEKGTCRRCGKDGHKIETCTNSPKCLICTRQKDAEDRHVVGSVRCPIRKEYLKGFKIKSSEIQDLTN